MAVTATPVFAQSPACNIATLTSPTAITSRANITGTTGLVQLCPSSTNGKRIDRIHIKSKATSVASNLSIWMYNGTTSFLYDEIAIAAVTASNTVASNEIDVSFENLVLPPTFQLYISVTVATDLTVFAHGGDY
jgi:hypothetical protein